MSGHPGSLDCQAASRRRRHLIRSHIHGVRSFVTHIELWRQHAAQARANQLSYERMVAAAERTAERSRGLEVDGLEL